MTKDETNKILLMIATERTRFEQKIIETEGGVKINATLFLWQEMFADFPYEVVRNAVKEYLFTTPGNYNPTCSDIRDVILSQTHPELKESPDVAFLAVLNAIQRFGASRKADALHALPPVIAETVQRCNWTVLCRSSEDDARSQFVTAYREYVNKAMAKLTTHQALSAGQAEQKALSQAITPEQAEQNRKRLDRLAAMYANGRQVSDPSYRTNHQSRQTLLKNEVDKLKALRDVLPELPVTPERVDRQKVLREQAEQLRRTAA